MGSIHGPGHVGRTVQFRDKTGTTVTGRVTKVSTRYGSMELAVDGATAVIAFPFRNPTTRFVD